MFLYKLVTAEWRPVLDCSRNWLRQFFVTTGIFNTLMSRHTDITIMCSPNTCLPTTRIIIGNSETDWWNHKKNQTILKLFFVQKFRREHSINKCPSLKKKRNGYFRDYAISSYASLFMTINFYNFLCMPYNIRTVYFLLQFNT